MSKEILDQLALAILKGQGFSVDDQRKSGLVYSMAVSAAQTAAAILAPALEWQHMTDAEFAEHCAANPNPPNAEARIEEGFRRLELANQKAEMADLRAQVTEGREEIARLAGLLEETGEVKTMFSKELLRVRVRAEAMATALQPFAGLLKDEGLDLVGGGTLIAPEIKVQLVRDAKAALKAYREPKEKV